MNAGKDTPVRVFLVDDEDFFREMTSESLARSGLKVSQAASAEEAREKIGGMLFDVLVLDVKMPGMDGLEFLKSIQDTHPSYEVVMLTGQATIPMAIEAMKLGAFDFLLKPCPIDTLLRVIGHAAEKGRLKRRNLILEKELTRRRGSGQIVGESKAIKNVINSIEIAAANDLPVLVTGETGTGKELVARAIHDASPRSHHPMVVVDGTILREELLASELFGHEKGAFTGAVKKKAGLFQVADQGSIFIDEIGEITLPNQSSLLRVLEERTFRPVGGLHEIKADVRVIAATNKDIPQAVTREEFRSDLYFRLKGMSIHVPPLRERPEDIVPIAKHFLKPKVELSSEAKSALLSYSWPGNVRELKYVIELAVLQAEDGVIQLNHLPEDVRYGKTGGLRAETTVESKEPITGCLDENLTYSEFTDCCIRHYLSSLVKKYRGKKAEIAKVLDISLSSLYEKLSRLGMGK